MKIARIALVGIVALVGILGVIGADCSQELPSQANFSANPTYGEAPLIVTFTDRSSEDPEIWYWEFGDGGTSSIENPTHTYEESGTYAVSLTVSKSDDSDTWTITEYITVV